MNVSSKRKKNWGFCCYRFGGRFVGVLVGSCLKQGLMNPSLPNNLVCKQNGPWTPDLPDSIFQVLSFWIYTPDLASSNHIRNTVCCKCHFNWYRSKGLYPRNLLHCRAENKFNLDSYCYWVLCLIWCFYYLYSFFTS